MKSMYDSGNCARPWCRTSLPGGDGGVARRRAWDVNNRIVEDEGGDNPPFFSTASQNVIAAVLLLRAMPEPSTPKGRRVRQGLRDLLEQAVVQNTESSTSQSHGARHPGVNPLLIRHQQCKARHPLTREGAPKPHPSTNASGPTWTREPPLRLDDTTRMRPSLGATGRAEAGGTTPTTTAARRQSLRVPASSARPSTGPNSRPDSDNPLTSPSTQGKQT